MYTTPLKGEIELIYKMCPRISNPSALSNSTNIPLCKQDKANFVEKAHRLLSLRSYTNKRRERKSTNIA
jgi:hypothetical protein